METNGRIARLMDAYARFAEADPGPMHDVLAADVVYHLPGRHLGGGVLRGRDALFERIGRAAAWCDSPPRIDLQNWTARDELVVTIERLVARRAERALDQSFCVVWRFDGESCVEIWSHPADQPACDEFWCGFDAPDLEAFFAGYAAAFDAFDAGRIASHYQIPAMLAGAGAVSTYHSREALVEHLDALLRQHRRQRYGTASFRGIEIVDLGGDVSLATVAWTMRDDAGSVLSQFETTYNMIRTSVGWKIVVATTHGR